MSCTIREKVIKVFNGGSPKFSSLNYRLPIDNKNGIFRLYQGYNHTRDKFIELNERFSNLYRDKYNIISTGNAFNVRELRKASRSDGFDTYIVTFNNLFIDELEEKIDDEIKSETNSEFNQDSNDIEIENLKDLYYKQINSQGNTVYLYRNKEIPSYEELIKEMESDGTIIKSCRI